MNDAPCPRVLIVAEHASARFGGEAILPLHYFRGLRRRGAPTWMIVHERTRAELAQILGDDLAYVHFLPDRWYHRLLHRLGRRLPGPLSTFGPGFISRLTTQMTARRVARRLIAANHIDVVHQPMPVSPREASLMYNLGAPVVMGPMNGAMSYPPGFRHMEGRGTGLFVVAGRAFSGCLNRLMPGKRHAATLLAANARTQAALPQKSRGRQMLLVENGVDIQLWHPILKNAADQPVRFLFCGRFADWKGLDLLLEAFGRMIGELPPSPSDPQLILIGDGPMRAACEQQAQHLGIAGRVHFRGWLPQEQCAREMAQADVLVLPSLYECGGAVVLEAMACGLPVIATNWGGPADYITPECGILVDPTDRPSFITALADAMGRLSSQPQTRRQLGAAGRQRVEAQFDWARKIDAILEVYAEAMGRWRSSSHGSRHAGP